MDESFNPLQFQSRFHSISIKISFPLYPDSWLAFLWLSLFVPLSLTADQ